MSGEKEGCRALSGKTPNTGGRFSLAEEENASAWRGRFNGKVDEEPDIKKSQRKSLQAKGAEGAKSLRWESLWCV